MVVALYRVRGHDVLSQLLEVKAPIIAESFSESDNVNETCSTKMLERLTLTNLYSHVYVLFERPAADC